MNGFDTSSQFERSGGVRAGGSFSRGRGGAGANRIGNSNNGILPPSFNQQSGLNTSQGPPQQGYQTSQGLPPHQGLQTSQGPPQQGYQTSQGLPPHQGLQTSQTGYSQGYTSEQLVGVRQNGGGGFDRSRGGMGSSFSRGQGSHMGGFGSSRQVATELGGGFQDRALSATHSMGGQSQSTGLNGMPDPNDEWQKMQVEAIARSSNIIPKETPAKMPAVVNLDPDVPILHGGAAIRDPGLQRIPVEQPIIRHPQVQVTPPPSQPLSSVPSQSVPLPSGAISGLLSAVANPSSKSDMEQISEITGMLAEAFRKLDIYIKSKK